MINDINLGIKKVNAESFKLTPSSLISLFEIDINNSVFESGFDSLAIQKVFRFHNSIKLTTNNIVFDSKTYIAAPIFANGFEMNTRGTIPTPKISISTNDSGIQALSNFKAAIKSYGDLVGAKVTRIRTFAKFLDAVNFEGQNPPAGFDPDPYAKFPSDVYFIDRKTNEDKNSLEFQLASILDLEGILLPGRTVISDRCNFEYRGEGCLYEYDGATPDTMRRNIAIHGENSTLPASAPPVATENDEDIVGVAIPGITSLVDKGEYNLSSTYSIGEFIYIQKNGIKYYYVAKKSVPAESVPPNENYWLADSCSRCITGCKKRFGTILPFGGFPAVNKLPA